MRLTEKFTNACGGCYEPITNDREVCDKLGQLEDIEDELGIDLVTLFKALKNKELYWKTNKYGIIKTTFDNESLRPEVSFDNYIDNEWSIGLVSNALSDDELLKDYGKTWALTKEELL